ncbi:MAG: GTPase domain-containing protein [Candidatus Lokiarchaeota archaeon]|nr:GTPase domain-containing protein [Candidatus Lokiarchaeota archaeon]
MLRQLHIYFKGKRIFSQTFAQALDDIEIENVANIFLKNINLPNMDKISSRRISEHKVFYKNVQNFYFFMVTDLIDTIDDIEIILNKAIKKFEILFHNIDILNDSLKKRQEYINYLIGLQTELHCKISIIGPSNAGKSGFYALLTNQTQERRIMNFAKVSLFEIYDSKFDVWDFQLKDNFSLLWSKFISGSDLVIFLFNASNYNLNVLDYFLTLKKKESPLSKFIIIANKTDLISEDEKRRIKNELNLINIHFLSLFDLKVKEEAKKIIGNVLLLKKSLPTNFNELIKQAESLAKQRNHVKALVKYKELIEIANTCQCFDQIDILKNKIEEVNKKIREKSDIRKKIERKMKFAPPKKITFNKEVKVKSLPKVQNLQKTIPKIEQPKTISMDIKQKKNDIKTEKIIDTKEIRQYPEEKYKNFEEIPDKGLLLQKMIQSRGSSLSINLCNKFLQEMKTSLNRQLTIEDLKTAVNIFLRHE